MSGLLWVKMYIETIDDPVYGQLGDRLYRRATELRLLAGREDRGGQLPPVADIAYALRVRSLEKLQGELEALQGLGILELNEGGWRFVSYDEDQRPRTPAERKAAQRERQRHALVTRRDSDVTRIEERRREETREEESARGELPPSPPSVADAPSEREGVADRRRDISTSGVEAAVPEPPDESAPGPPDESGLAISDKDLRWVDPGRPRELAREHFRITGEPLPTHAAERERVRVFFVDLADSGGTAQDVRRMWTEHQARERDTAEVRNG